MAADWERSSAVFAASISNMSVSAAFSTNAFVLSSGMGAAAGAAETPETPGALVAAAASGPVTDALASGFLGEQAVRVQAIATPPIAVFNPNPFNLASLIKNTPRGAIER